MVSASFPNLFVLLFYIFDLVLLTLNKSGPIPFSLVSTQFYSCVQCGSISNMPPFRNLLNRKPATTDGNNDNNETPQSQQLTQSLEVPRSTPLSLNNSREEVPNEYKLSGMLPILRQAAPRTYEHNGVKKADISLVR